MEGIVHLGPTKMLFVFRVSPSPVLPEMVPPSKSLLETTIKSQKERGGTPSSQVPDWLQWVGGPMYSWKISFQVKTKGQSNKISVP